MIGMGESDGPNRVEDAVQRAVRSPLIDVDISGATAALVNVTGGPDMTLADAEGVVKHVHQMISSDARIIWGVQVNPEMQGSVRVLLILTGVRSPQIYGRSERHSSEIQNHFEIDFLK
jgi:cell division protein FtsZ